MNRREKNARFLTRGLLGILVIVICLTPAFLLYECWTYHRRWQEEQLTRMLEQDPRIGSIAFEGFSDGPCLYKIETVSFSIKGKPGSKIVFLGPDADESTFDLFQIGGLRPRIERVNKDTGRSSYGFPTLGGSSNDGIPLGVDIKTIGDLITHYDEVHAYFNEWPELPRSIKIISTEESTLYGSLDEWSVRE
jgi:hypothetical protein